VFFVDDNELVGRTFVRFLRGAAEIVVAPARVFLAEGAFDLAMCDLALPDGDGASRLEEAERFCPGARRVLVSALGPPPSGGQEAVEAGVGKTPRPRRCPTAFAPFRQGPARLTCTANVLLGSPPRRAR
jgi:CheY-like chemotaxis protein